MHHDFVTDSDRNEPFSFDLVDSGYRGELTLSPHFAINSIRVGSKFGDGVTTNSPRSPRSVALPRFRRHLHYAARPGLSGPFPFSIRAGYGGGAPVYPALQLELDRA